MTSRSYFDKMNSILVSVVPLTMFLIYLISVINCELQLKHCLVYMVNVSLAQHVEHYVECPIIFLSKVLKNSLKGVLKGFTLPNVHRKINDSFLLNALIASFTTRTNNHSLLLLKDYIAPPAFIKFQVSQNPTEIKLTFFSTNSISTRH